MAGCCRCVNKMVDFMRFLRASNRFRLGWCEHLRGRCSIVSVWHVYVRVTGGSLVGGGQ